MNVSRCCGIGFGLITHFVFAATVWRLYQFLHDPTSGAVDGSLWIDLALAAQFAVPHSLLLHPACRRRLALIVPGPFYGCFYTLTTSATLWIAFLFWRRSSIWLWQLSGWGAGIAGCGFIASWAALLYSLRLTGLGWQTGWTPWLAWLRGQPQPQRAFVPRGAYRLFRHPVYFSFLGLIWFTPSMSLDHAVLTGVWSIYILFGSYLKDERLVFYLGETYRSYQREVVGYPGMFTGPLGKRRPRGPGSVAINAGAPKIETASARSLNPVAALPR